MAWADVADQLNEGSLAVFGEAANYRPVIGAPFDLVVVFDEAFLPLTINDATSQISSTNPIAGVRVADFPLAPREDDRIFVPRAGQLYLVQNVEFDGHGWARLQLLETRG